MAERKRQRIKTGSGARFVRRDEQGKFKEEVSVGTSLSRDRRKKAKTIVKSGQGDKGDQKRR